MNMMDIGSSGQNDAIVLCPCCGSADHEDNRLDDALYIEAAKEAPRLRYEGRTADVIEVLSAFFAIRIANFIRPRWRCVSCGGRYDG